MVSNGAIEHRPVLLNEVIELLSIKDDGVYIDMTVGLGGHSAAILEKLGPSGVLIGIDRDPDAIRIASERLNDKRVFLRRGRFSEAREIVSGLCIDSVDGVLLDLGVSMLQLKDRKRGFSFMSDDRLDMRMNAQEGPSAWEIINKYSEKELQRVLTEYGEEPLFKRISRMIIEARKVKEINTCSELANIVMKAYGGRGKTHPATRTFQALRIEVNQELEELSKGLSAMVSVLRPNARACVIAYHSLEDRIVKNFFKGLEREGTVRALTKKPVVPSRQEILENPASRSAKLRGIEKL